MRVWSLKVTCAAAVLALVPGLAQAQARTDLVVGMQLEPPNLDPTASAAAAISEVTLVNLYEALTRIDAEGAVGPGLAKSWTVSEDALTYRFKLRDTARFHNGKPATSADVKFSLDRARAADSTNPQKAYFKAIEAVETPDPQTVVVKLSRPDGLFLFHMGLGAAVIQSAETQPADKQTPVGTGPFKFERWISGDRVVLVRNPDYDGPKPALERVSFRFIADPAAQVSSILAGDVDTVPQFNTYEALPQFKNDPRFRVVTGTSEGETVLSTNNARKPFDDVRVRRALAHAIDRATLIEGAMSGLATPIGSHFAPNRPEYVDLTGLYPYDVKKAKALLAEAGYPNGFETTLRLPPPIYARRSGELIAAMLAEAGIRAKVENLEWAQWLEKVFRGKDFDLSIVAHTEALDIEIYSRPDYYFGYKSDRFNALNAELERTLDPARRKALYGDMQRLLAEDSVNGFLFQLPVVTVENAKVVGMWKNRPYQVNDVTGVRWQ
jgi:peptide/nickel transport system substrate-binding protein